MINIYKKKLKKMLFNTRLVTLKMLIIFYVYFTLYLGYGDCKMETKIVGGIVPNITEFPHVAYMGIQCELKDPPLLVVWICGSSILNQRLLLTAAHCLADCTSESRISVSVGSVFASKGIRSSGSSYLVHEHYYTDTNINDIGLLKLTTALNFTVNVNRLVLMNNPPYNEIAQVAGWGVINEETNAFGTKLKYINQRVWDLADCWKLLKSIPRGTFCAASDNEKDYASRGDSGSALVVRGYIQIGLVSYKKPGTSKQVVVYTDIGFFYNWIIENAMRLLCDD